jgi:hypothetical protein
VKLQIGRAIRETKTSELAFNMCGNAPIIRRVRRYLG